jgi:hypothetical protein
MRCDLDTTTHEDVHVSLEGHLVLIAQEGYLSVFRISCTER